MSQSEKVWKTIEVEESAAQNLANSLSLPMPVARILTARGISDQEEAQEFLSPLLSNLSDPFELPGMTTAVDRIWEGITKQESILVFGDYDADGVTGTVLLISVLRKLGANPEWFIPNRKNDGYGFSKTAQKHCIDEFSPNLIITVDCGTNSHDAVSAAAKNGVDVVVTDHHETDDEKIPPAISVVNPKLGDNDAVKMLAGVGVVFKLCHALIKQGIENNQSEVKDLDLRQYLDIVALGTVADVVPLTGENRTLVRHGLKQINKSPCCGLTALIRSASIRTTLDCYHLGFLLGPRINAVGRMGSSEKAVELLLIDDPAQAKRLSGQLDSANRERRRVEETIVQAAVSELGGDKLEDDVYGIVVGREDWHIGTIGIVAARLCGRYKRPAVVIGFDENGFGRGSCRSVDSIDIADVLNECSDLLLSCGGHKMAAGLSIEKENLNKFRNKFNKICKERMHFDDMVPTQNVDSWISLSEADERLLKAIESLKPLGQGNPTPIWGARALTLVGQPQIVGKNHLKMVVASGATQLDAIAFWMAGREIENEPLDMLFHVQENNYMGQKTIQLNIKDFRPAKV